jgi:hypothetical protein
MVFSSKGGDQKTAISAREGAADYYYYYYYYYYYPGFDERFDEGFDEGFFENSVFEIRCQL